MLLNSEIPSKSIIRSWMPGQFLRWKLILKISIKNTFICLHAEPNEPCASFSETQYAIKKVWCAHAEGILGQHLQGASWGNIFEVHFWGTSQKNLRKVHLLAVCWLYTLKPVHSDMHFRTVRTVSLRPPTYSRMVNSLADLFGQFERAATSMRCVLLCSWVSFSFSWW